MQITNGWKKNLVGSEWFTTAQCTVRIIMWPLEEEKKKSNLEECDAQSGLWCLKKRSMLPSNGRRWELHSTNLHITNLKTSRSEVSFFSTRKRYQSVISLFEVQLDLWDPTTRYFDNNPKQTKKTFADDSRSNCALSTFRPQRRFWVIKKIIGITRKN